MTKPDRNAVMPPRSATHVLTAAPHEPGYHSCFGCGTAVSDGLRIRAFDDHSSELTAAVRLRNVHQGERGLAHGGIVTAMLDEVISLALWRVLDRKFVTRRLDTNFLAPVPIDKDIELRAKCTGVHDRKAYGQARVLIDGTVLAHAVGLFIQVRSEDPA
jgi:acyl-coenzyme A thioesterase PaaI-like protein